MFGGYRRRLGGGDDCGMDTHVGALSARAGAVVAGSVCIALAAAPAAQAVVPLEAATGPNTITFTFVNNDAEVTTCEAYAAGPVSFRTPATRVPARSTATVSFVDVPAGNYVLDWACRGFDQGKRMVSVGGEPLPGATPRQGPAPSTGARTPLPTGSFGSS